MEVCGEGAGVALEASAPDAALDLGRGPSRDRVRGLGLDRGEGLLGSGGRVQQWREQGRRWWDLAGAIRGKSEVVEGWVRSLERNHREGRAALGREQGREVRELGVLRPRRLGYREARFEKIKQRREYVAGMYEYQPDQEHWQNEWRRGVARKAKGDLDALIQSLPEGDRKELERRDRKHPPPAMPQQQPAETQEQSRGYGPPR